MNYQDVLAYDPTGTLAANLIKDEPFTIQPPNEIDGKSWMIPDAAPFFGAKMQIWTGRGKTGTKLTLGVDYAFCLQFPEAIIALGAPVYGGIIWLNMNITAPVYLTYQSLGGPYCTNAGALLETLVESEFDVLFVTWGNIAGVPVAFASDPHDHMANDGAGFTQVVDALGGIQAAILAAPSFDTTAFIAHLNSQNAHSKSSVGLSQVNNWPAATADDMVAGIFGADKYLTPALAALLYTNVSASLVQKVTTVENNLKALYQRFNITYPS